MKTCSLRAAMALMAFVLVALTGCGGGDDSNAGNADTRPSFALQAAYQARIVSGVTDTFVVSGVCTGTASLAVGAVTPATFESVNGYQALTRSSFNLMCGAASSVVTDEPSTEYFDANYMPIGSSDPEEYVRFTSAPVTFAAQVRAGDAGSLGTSTVYSDSTKTSVTGQQRSRYVVQAETPTTVLVVITTDYYGAAGQIESMDDVRYRLELNGSLTMVSMTSDLAGPNPSRVVFTKV